MGNPHASGTIDLATALPVSVGDTVTFNVTVQHVNTPRVEVLAYQDGQLVYGQAGDPADTFTLGGVDSDWLRNGGPADCIANLYYFTTVKGQPATVYLAQTQFPAS